ncbi:hypothetical protein [Burkholderia ubonensis]|uniref:hypothetical protein n=1 Tax=Burkholderia ubonensis TaxID=101571 RepID=UPI000B0472AC|nr:hypothetical protein [Burkholderia ubonensis]
MTANSNDTAGALPADAPGVVHARRAAARARHAGAACAGGHGRARPNRAARTAID